jgi:hypothetical protein
VPVSQPKPHEDSLQPEAEGEWPAWADRVFTWGMLIAIPVVGVGGFALLTTIEHPRAGELPAATTPAPHRATLLAAPELDSPLPSVRLGKAAAPKGGLCPGHGAASDAAPCDRPPAPAAAEGRSTAR